MTLALPATVIPRAVCAMPRADASDPKAMIAALNNAFEEFKATNDAAIEGKVDGLVTAKLEAINAT
jgi:hypothetical protein